LTETGVVDRDNHGGPLYNLEMKPRVRELLHATPFEPFIIRMADGRECRVEHPDFVLAASNEQTQVVIEDAAGGMHFLSPLLITSLERVTHGPNGSAVAT
jgi:hypothetical protein